MKRNLESCSIKESLREIQYCNVMEILENLSARESADSGTETIAKDSIVFVFSKCQ